MGFDGVAITDDVGAAKAVAGGASRPSGRQRFIAAGGDIVLTAKASGQGPGDAPKAIALPSGQRARLSPVRWMPRLRGCRPSRRSSGW